MTSLVTKFKVVGALAVAIAAGVGGTLGVLHVLPKSGAAAHAAGQTAAGKPPGPLLFADLSNVVVSIPPDPGAPATSYVQFGVQFSTHDQKALDNFTALQPIIKAEVISQLMSETGHGLQDPQTRAALTQSCLAIANNIVAKNAGDKLSHPFDAAYITDLVVQD